MVLLILDVQKLITNESLYGYEIFVKRVKALIESSRKNGVEVIYVRHDDGAGSALAKGAAGFEISEEFCPKEGEKIFEKTVNSAFRDCGLREHIEEKGEKRVMIVGLQTEYCIDATIKGGFERGIEMIVPAGTNSTFDNDFMSAETTYKYYNEFIWRGRYAKCVEFEEAVEMISGKIQSAT